MSCVAGLTCINIDDDGLRAAKQKNREVPTILLYAHILRNPAQINTV